MKETSIYEYYSFGYNYHHWRFNWSDKIAKRGKDDIDNYLRKIEALSLPVTSKVVMPLYQLREKLDEFGPEEKIPRDTAEDIEKTFDDTDKTLDAELQLKKVLFVTPKRFDVEKLLTHPRSLMAHGAWDQLSDTARTDFQDAAKCIALGLPTSAAFHLMRCVEGMIGQLYYTYVKRNRMDKLMWGPMVEKLRNKRNPKPETQLLDQLDMIRVNFRNPTQHPQKIYDMEEAQDLMHLSIVALNGVVQSVNKR